MTTPREVIRVGWEMREDGTEDFQEFDEGARAR